MSACTVCGQEVVRTKRNFVQRLYTLAIFKCPRCDQRMYLRRRFFSIFSWYAQCPKCGTRGLSKLKSRDRVDRLNKNPLRLLLAVVRAPLYHCTFCRLQFWDWRSRQPGAQKQNAGGGAGRMFR